MSIFSEKEPRAVRLGYWKYAGDFALMMGPLWGGLAVLNLHEPTLVANVELLACMLIPAGIMICVISFCMWAGARLAWRYGGKIGRWAAMKHAYGERDS